MNFTGYKVYLVNVVRPLMYSEFIDSVHETLESAEIRGDELTEGLTPEWEIKIEEHEVMDIGGNREYAD